MTPRLASLHLNSRAAVNLSLLACLFYCLPSLAQSNAASDPSATSGLYRVAGTIVNAITGEHVPRATVAVLNLPQSQIVQTALSDDNGHFSLDKLPAAKYQLTVSKRGFRTAFFNQHEDYNSAIVTGPGQETDQLSFRLTPDAVLHGVITADAGEPVEGARVLLFRKPSKNNSSDQITPAGNADTDDTGAYEFSGLAPGEYLLAVKATPWYAVHPHTSQSTQPSRQSEASAQLDVAYPITFYSGTTEEGSATPILLAAGSREEANLSLSAVPALHLTVPLPAGTGPGADRQAFVPQVPRTVLHQSVFGTEISTDEVNSVNYPRGANQPGEAEFNSVAPGHYQLEEGNPPRTMELNASSSQQIDTAQATPSIQVAIQVRSSAGTALPETRALTLESLDAGHRFIPMQAPPRPGESFSAAVPPGNWRVLLISDNSSLTVLSIAEDGKVHSGNRFTVRDHPLSLVITVTQSATRIEGFARKDNKGIAGAMIILLPQSPQTDHELIRRDQSDSDGSFALLDAAPGDYIVVAIENGWDLDWADPKVMARYLSLAVPVTIKSTSGKLMRLSQPIPVQSASTTP
jgi:protocatechuate 3,4-dioxygenase beta subunit